MKNDMGSNMADSSKHSDSEQSVATIDDMLFAFGDLPAKTQIHKGKNYWTVSYGGVLKVRNRRLAECLVGFVEEWEAYNA